MLTLAAEQITEITVMNLNMISFQSFDTQVQYSYLSWKNVESGHLAAEVSYESSVLKRLTATKFYSNGKPVLANQTAFPKFNNQVNFSGLSGIAEKILDLSCG